MQSKTSSNEYEQNVITKMALVKTILNTCNAFLDKIDNDNDSFKKAIEITAVDPYVMYKAKNLRPQINFREWLLYESIVSVRSPRSWIPQTYERLREIIINSYLINKVLPTKSSFNVINVPYYSIKIDLKDRGFVWKPIPKSEKSALVEKPEQCYKRMRYLQKIAQHRAHGRNIVYVEEKNLADLTINEEMYNLNQHLAYFLMAAGENGFITLSYQANFKYQYFNYFLSDLVLLVPESSVIVLGEKSHNKQHDKIPDQNSTKIKMRQWLDENHVPYDNSFNKAELFYLIDRFKNKVTEKTMNIEGISRTYGHEILYRPYGLEMINFFKPFWNQIQNILANSVYPKTMRKSIETAITSLKNRLTKENWKEFEETLLKVEKKVYKEDMQMEEVIDRLMMMAKEWDLNLGPECVTETCEDYFLRKILVE